MTREEAIKLLQASRIMLLGNDNQPISDLYYALEMAIQAMLENEELSKDLDEALKEIDGYERGLSQECVGSMQKCVGNALEMRCDDAVSRQAVLDLMRSLKRWCVRSQDGKFNNVGLLYDDVMFGIDKLPPVTQKPNNKYRKEARRWKNKWLKAQKSKTGHWIKHDGYWECSECHTERAYGNEYCPDCGSHNGDIANPYKESEG